MLRWYVTSQPPAGGLRKGVLWSPSNALVNAHAVKGNVVGLGEGDSVKAVKGVEARAAQVIEALGVQVRSAEVLAGAGRTCRRRHVRVGNEAGSGSAFCGWDQKQGG
jgi:hypothetical protein